MINLGSTKAEPITLKKSQQRQRSYFGDSAPSQPTSRSQEKNSGAPNRIPAITDRQSDPQRTEEIRRIEGEAGRRKGITLRVRRNDGILLSRPTVAHPLILVRPPFSCTRCGDSAGLFYLYQALILGRLLHAIRGDERR
jgi:hypothetical protein